MASESWPGEANDVDRLGEFVHIDEASPSDTYSCQKDLPRRHEEEPPSCRDDCPRTMVLVEMPFLPEAPSINWGPLIW